MKTPITNKKIIFENFCTEIKHYFILWVIISGSVLYRVLRFDLQFPQCGFLIVPGVVVLQKIYRFLFIPYHIYFNKYYCYYFYQKRVKNIQGTMFNELFNMDNISDVLVGKTALYGR